MLGDDFEHLDHNLTVWFLFTSFGTKLVNIIRIQSILEPEDYDFSHFDALTPPRIHGH